MIGPKKSGRSQPRVNIRTVSEVRPTERLPSRAHELRIGLIALYVACPLVIGHWGSRMHALILNADQSTKTFLAQMCTAIFGPDLDIAEQDADEMDSDAQVARALNANHHFILLPLTLPHYMSLRLGEQAHLYKSPTVLVLCSETSTRRETVLQLFDGFCSPHCNIDELRAAVTASPRRLSTSKEVERAVEGLLREAPCFETRSDDIFHMDQMEAPTLGQYRSIIRQRRDSMKTKTSILLFASNPKGTSPLDLDEEVRSIMEKIRAAEYRDVLEFLPPALATRPDDLLQRLNEHKPQIVHFSGHGSSSGELMLMDKNREMKPVSTAALRALFTTMKDNVRVVLLNACFSQIQADALRESIDCVIGMNATN